MLDSFRVQPFSLRGALVVLSKAEMKKISLNFPVEKLTKKNVERKLKMKILR